MTNVHPESAKIGRLMLRITIRDQKHQEKHTQRLRAALTGPIIKSAARAEQREQRINRDIHKKLTVLAQHRAKVSEANKGSPEVAAQADLRQYKKAVNLKKNMEPVGYIQRGPICDQHRQELMKDLSELGLTDKLERQCLLFLNHIILSNAQTPEKLFVPIANKLLRRTCRSLVSPWSYKDTGVTHKTVVRLLESAGIIDRKPHNRQCGLSAEYKLSDKLMDRLAIASRPNMDRFGPKQKALLAEEPRRLLKVFLNTAADTDDMEKAMLEVIETQIDESKSGYFDDWGRQIQELIEDGYVLPTPKTARDAKGRALPAPRVLRTKYKKRVCQLVLTALDRYTARPINVPAIELAMHKTQIAYDFVVLIQQQLVDVSTPKFNRTVQKMARKLGRQLVAQHTNFNVILHSFDAAAQTQTYIPSYRPTRTGRVSEIHGGLQNSCRRIKMAALLGTNLHNYDVVSAQVECLYHLMQKYKQKSQWVQAYLANDNSKDIWARRLGIRVDTWKTCLYAIFMCGSLIHGPDYRAVSTALSNDPHVKDGRKKLKELTALLGPLLNELEGLMAVFRKKMGYRKEGIRNPMGLLIKKDSTDSQIMASMLQGQEALFIHTLALNMHKGKIVANEHDGLITTALISKNAIALTNKQLGTNFTLKEKNPESSCGKKLSESQNHFSAMPERINKEGAQTLRVCPCNKQKRTPTQTKQNQREPHTTTKKQQRTNNNIIYYSTPEFKPPLSPPDDQFDPVQRQLASWMPQVEYLSDGRAVYTVH